MSSSTPNMIENMTVVDAGVLDCGICASPLKPPVFQCEVGHMVRSRCSKTKMGPPGSMKRCYACRRDLPGGYRRCLGVEHILKSLKVPCPNAAYGCSAMLHCNDDDQQAHLRRDCRHAPCHCPADNCTFTGSPWDLRAHFYKNHGWPYSISTNATDGMFKLSLNEGFHAIHHYRSSCVDEDRAIPDQLYLFLLNVVREPHGCVVTAFYVHRAVPVDESAVASECRLKLAYESPCGSHRQESTFNVACTDLFGGLPSSDDCVEFVVSKPIHPLYSDTIEISVSIDIND